MALMNCAQGNTKSAAYRIKVAYFIDKCVDHLGTDVNGTREIERLFPIVAAFLNEGEASKPLPPPP
jgi:hypothetical protein